MSRELTYYFSTGSRYSYLSMSQLPDIEQRYGVEFNWVPVNGKRIRSLRGADPFAGPPQSGQYDWDYRETDAKAWAAYYGIEFVEPQDVEFDVELLLRAVIAAQQQGQVRAYAWSLAREVFALGTWPLDQTVADRVARDLDLDMDAFSAACAASATQTRLEDNCSEAVARGAFGTPTLFVGEDMFWGNDRLPLVRHRLAERVQAGGEAFTVHGLDHVVLRSAEPEALAHFYGKLLNATLERTVGDFLWQLRVGDSLLDIMRTQAGDGGAGNMDHYCLRVSPYDETVILDVLQRAGVEGQIAGRIYGAQGYGPSIYFVDPAGNRVELKRFNPTSDSD